MPSLGCGAWVQALLERFTCNHAINKGFFSFKCRPLLTYLPAHGPSKDF